MCALRSFVYAKCLRRARWNLWDCLQEHICGDFSCLVAGDFNIIRDYYEKVGVLMRARGPNEDFNDCYHDCEQLDLPFEGSKFS